MSKAMDPHPDSETLLAFREHRLAGPAVVDVARHVGECARCTAAEPSAGRELLEALVIRDVREERAWWPIAAAIVLAVLALSAIALLVLRRTTPAAVPVAVPMATGTAPKPAPPAPRAVASVVDGGRRIALLEDGTITGVELRSPRDAEDVRALLSGRSIAVPAFIAAMPGAVRGV